MIKKKETGQSVLELLFSVAVLILVLGGVTSLLVKSLNGRTKGFDRKKASELAELVMEDLVAKEKNDPETFWQMEDLNNESNSDFEGYEYSVGFSGVDGTADCVGANSHCAYVEVRVDWVRDKDESVVFNRYFSNQ